MKRLMAVILMGTALLYGSQQSTPAEKQLQAAINKEVVEGDLKGAIDLYSKLAQGADRAIAAQALLHMGECYEKLGESQATEARKAYERVVRDFADQKEPLAAAQKHLAEKAAPPESGMTVHRLATFTDGREFNSISRDGRYLGFCKDDGVYVYDRAKNEDRRIVPKASPGERFSDASLFPDGKQVAYLVNQVHSYRSEVHTIGIDGSNPRLVTGRKLGGKEGDSISEMQLSPDGKQIAFNVNTRAGGYDQESIYVMNADGANQRLLFRAEKDEGSDGFHWSPDGKHLVLLLWNDEHQERSRTVLVSVADGSSRVIGPETHAAFSPDSRSIAIHLANNFNTLVADGLYLIAVDGGKEVLLVPGTASYPIWTPDGKRILFRSRRPDQSDIRNPQPYGNREPFDLYSIRVAVGKPEGKPELMKKDVLMPDSEFFDPMPDGTFYFRRHPLESPNVYVADLDPATGKAVSKPYRLNRTLIDSSAGPLCWSPDGQWLAYLRYVEDGLMNPWMIKSTATGEEHELTISPPFTSRGWRDPLQWFPDNRSILAADHINGRFVFRKVDVQTGQQQLFFERPGYEAPGRSAALSPDGKMLFFSLSQLGTTPSTDAKIPAMNALRLMRRNMDTGEENELFRTHSPSRVTGFSQDLFSGFDGNIAMSFDGRQLAFTSENTDNTTSLLWMPSDGGEARELHRSEHLMNPRSWTKDGRHILVVQSDPANGMQQLWSVSAESGERVPTGLTFPRIGGSSLHPDGRRFTFIGWQPGQTELWVMKLQPPSPKP